MMIQKEQLKPVVILLYVIVAATVWKYFSIPFDPNDVDRMNQFWLGTHKLVGSFLLFGLIPIGIVKFLFQENLSDYGLRWGILFRTVRSFLIASPFIILIAYLTGHNSAFYNIYPLNESIRPQYGIISYKLFAVHAVIYWGYYWGWEFLFRGFLQHGLYGCCGIGTAILIQTLASTMLHYGHPASEVFGSMIAGLVWGYLAYRTKSILSGFGQHALLGLVLDWTLVFDRH